MCVWPRKQLPDSSLLFYSQQLKKWELWSAGGGSQACGTSAILFSMVAQHRCKWESRRHARFLFPKCKSYLCHNPKPTAAPQMNAFCCACLSACTISIQESSAFHLLLCAFYHFPTNLREGTPLCSLQQGHLFQIWDGFLPSFPSPADHQGHLGCCQLELDFQG